MEKLKKINKAATIRNIVEWANRGLGKNINLTKFNALMEKEDWEEHLKEAAKFCGTEIVYE